MQAERKKRSDTFWSRELILEGLAALVKANVTVNCYRLARDKSESTTEILLENIGIPSTGAKLYSAAYKEFGGLYKALAKAGINHKEVRTDTKFWSKDDLANALKALHKEKIPLCVVKIEKDRTERTRLIIYKGSKIKCSGFKLYRKSIKKFGSWDAALRYSDIDPLEIRRIVWSWDKRKVIKCIRYLHKNKIPINLRSLENDRGGFISKKLSLFLNEEATASKLYVSGRKQFGCWDNALIAAGFKPKNIRKDKKFWTRKMMIDSIKALDERGINLDCYKMQFDRTSETSEIITTFTRRKATGASLYSFVASNYGSWTKVVKAVRNNPERIGVSSKFLTKRTIVKSIRSLNREGIALNSGNLIKHNSDSARLILARTISTPISGCSLYNNAKKHFGSWDEALKVSSFDPSLIRRRGLSVEQSGKDFEKIVFSIKASGKPLNSSSLVKSSKEIRSVTYKELGKVISGFSALSYGKNRFDGWENALRSIGLNPLEIVLRSRHGWSLSTINHQIERVELGNGLVRKVALMGEAPKTPEQILEEREGMVFLDKAMESFSLADKAILDEVFDLILQLDNFGNQKQLIEAVSSRMRNKISEHKIKDLFDKIASQGLFSK